MEVDDGDIFSIIKTPEDEAASSGGEEEGGIAAAALVLQGARSAAGGNGVGQDSSGGFSSRPVSGGSARTKTVRESCDPPCAAHQTDSTCAFLCRGKHPSRPQSSNRSCRWTFCSCRVCPTTSTLQGKGSSLHKQSKGRHRQPQRA